MKIKDNNLYSFELAFNVFFQGGSDFQVVTSNVQLHR